MKVVCKMHFIFLIWILHGDTKYIRESGPFTRSRETTGIDE